MSSKTQMQIFLWNAWSPSIVVVQQMPNEEQKKKALVSETEGETWLKPKFKTTN